LNYRHHRMNLLVAVSISIQLPIYLAYTATDIRYTPASVWE
jgi:hypothetical protein